MESKIFLHPDIWHAFRQKRSSSSYIFLHSQPSIYHFYGFKRHPLRTALTQRTFVNDKNITPQ